MPVLPNLTFTSAVATIEKMRLVPNVNSALDEVAPSVAVRTASPAGTKIADCTAKEVLLERECATVFRV